MARLPINALGFLVLLSGFCGLQNQALAVTVCKDGTCDHTSIKSALLDVSHKGEDVIITKPGTFEESELTIGGTTQGGPRTLMSLNDDPAGTIIDATGSGKAVVSCLGLSTIRGITLRGGNGGVRVCYGGGSRLENVIIEDNIATDAGGGVKAVYGPLTIIDSVIRNNKAVGNGGGISLNGSEGLTIKNSRIENNEVTGYNGIASGGGVAIGPYITLLIEDTDIVGNKVFATNQTRGGGISSPTTTILNNVNLSNNIAGPAAFFSGGGGIYKNKTTSSGPLLEINGGSISGNVADEGGGIWLGNTAALNLFGGTVSSNDARDGVVGSGGGIFCGGSRDTFLAAGHVSGNTPDQVAGCTTSSVGTTRTQADNTDSGDSNDPVNTRTGELFNQYDPDINLGGPMPLFFARYYASGFKQVGVSASLGDNWRHNFSWQLIVIGSSMDIVNHQGRAIQFAWNGASWDLVGKTGVVYQLDENAGVFTLLDPRSQRTYTFNSDGQLSSIADGKGNIHSLTYASALLSYVSDGLGRSLNFSYDNNNDLIGINDGLGRSVIFAYTGSDLTGVTDLNGNTTVYSYATQSTLNNQSLMWTTTRPLGNRPYRHSFWFADKKVAGEKDSNNFNTSFHYTSATETKITDPLGNIRIHSHTLTGGLSDNQDQTGQSIVIGYDAAARRDTMTDRAGNTTSNNYDPQTGQLISITLPGSTINFDYAARTINGLTYYDQTEIAYPDGTKEAFTYDASGNMTSHTDQRTNTRSFSYTLNGQRLQKTNKLGGLVSYTYNADLSLASRTNNAGKTTTYGYDIFGRLVLINYPDGTSQEFSWDDKGRLLSETDERENATSIIYDINDNVISTTDAAGNITTYIYDDNDRLLSITDALGNVSSRSYDELGRVSVSTDGNGNFATFEYDSRSNVISVSDSVGNAWLTDHDVDSFATSTSDPLGNTTTYLRDSLHRITRRTNPLGDTMDISYDIMGRISSTTDSLGKITVFNYDANGRMASVTLPDGTSTVYTRNPLGQITTLVDPNGSDWGYAYDNMGQKTSVTDPLGNTSILEYDDNNRPSVVNLPEAPDKLDITYDDTGNVTRLLYSDGTDLNFTYDAHGRATAAEGLTQTFDANGKITNSNDIENTYDADGHISSIKLAPDKLVTYAYDANNQLTKITDWAGGITTFSYDIAGRLIAMERPNNIELVKTYDDNSRLTDLAENSISSIHLARNGNGQITSSVRDVPQSNSSSGFPDSNHTFDAASQVTGFSYDKLGRRTAAGADSFNWDLASRLISYTVAGSTITNSYDALGRRTRRMSSGITSDYVWNDALELSSISIEQRGATDFRYFIHTPQGQLLYSIDASANTRSFYHFDEMGNTIFVTNDAGLVTASYAYSPYGKLMASSGSLDNPFTWQGETGVMNEENGLYYMRARYYDSGAGRFISRDPKKGLAPETVNPYQYALANPLLYVDPKGEMGGDKSGGFDGSIADTVIGGSTSVTSYTTVVVGKGAEITSSILEKDFKTTLLRDPPGVTKTNFLDDVLTRKHKADKLADNMDKLGKAADVLSAVGTSIKTAESLNKVHERGQMGRKTALQGLNTRLDEVIRLVKKGKISDEMAEKLIKDISASFDDEISGAWAREFIDTKIEALKSIKETLVGLAGPVGDAVDKVLSIFGFKDPKTD